MAKVALVVGTCTYQDVSFSKLAAPAHDVRGLAEALRDPSVGGFDEVHELVDRSSRDVQMEISNAFADREKDDLVVVYISGHGYKDRGRLYFVFSDTLRHRLNATAIPADFLKQEMEASAARRQVLILDCCHAGAFSQGMKSGAGLGDKAGVLEELPEESGKIVLTASDAIQYAYEGDAVSGQAQHSVFTKHLLEGLRTGAADMDGDGAISVDELFDYVSKKVREERPGQKPQRSAAGESGDVFIAKSPYVKPAQLSPDLVAATSSKDKFVVMGSIDELWRLLEDPDPRMAAAARGRLEQMLKEDHFRSVHEKVEEALASVPVAPPTRPGGLVPPRPPIPAPTPAIKVPPVPSPAPALPENEAAPFDSGGPPVQRVTRRTTPMLSGIVTFLLDGNPVEVTFFAVGPHTLKYCGNTVSSKLWNVNNHSVHKFKGIFRGAPVQYMVAFTKLTTLLELSSRPMKVSRDGMVIYDDDGTVGFSKG